jgi:NodT family efflux transporter outer membrane factor (OMF) lipoprotein
MSFVWSSFAARTGVRKGCAGAHGLVAARLRMLGCIMGAVSLAACSMGSDYVTPTVTTPAAFKEARGWKLATPRDDIAKDSWWQAFKDPYLDQLERQVELSNQSLKQSEAQYRAALALIREAQAGLFPAVGATYQATRARSANAAANNPYTTTYTLEGTATWDLDVWGRIRRTVESDAAAAQASAADIANAKLSIQAQLATAYFNLRSADNLHSLLLQTAKEYQRTYDITQNQYNAGVAAKSDVVTALAQLKTVQAQAINATLSRAQYEHAIAMLIGKPPAEVSIPAKSLTGTPPRIPATVPSQLLERRPDIAAAERTMQQQNALIGAALGAYFPDISLSGLLGATGARPLPLTFANEFWSIGALATQPIVDGGLHSAQVEAARANYEASVAAYRQTVLTSFQQVEDQLSNGRILDAQANVQAEAVKAARQAVQIVLNEYRAGTASFTAVVTAQATLLNDEQAALTIRQNRYIASVALIQALGGGWSQVLPDLNELRSVSVATALTQ